MQVVVHHRVGVDGHRKAFGQQHDALLNLGLAMPEGLVGVAVLPAQEGTAHAALDAVERAVGAGSDQLGTGRGHGASIGA